MPVIQHDWQPPEHEQAMPNYPPIPDKAERHRILEREWAAQEAAKEQRREAWASSPRGKLYHRLARLARQIYPTKRHRRAARLGAQIEAKMKAKR